MRFENNSVVQVSNNDITNGTITIPSGAISIMRKAFHRCGGLIDITIPENVTSIGDAAFYGCSSLSSIIIPEGVVSIGDCAFDGCKNLPHITIPKTVTSIGVRAFGGCIGLTHITIPKGVTSIANALFLGCSNLTTITIPERITSIGSSAFYGCISLTSIIIPESITAIGNIAFLGCNKLTTIIITAQSDVEFQRVKALLPENLQSLADHNGEKNFRPCVDAIHKILADDAKAVGVDEEVLEQLTDKLNAAQTHLENMKTFPTFHQRQKKELDSLIVTVYLHQRDLHAALGHYQKNPILNDEVIAKLAFATQAFESKDLIVKHQAMISLFKAYSHIAEVQKLLIKSALYVEHQEEPPFGIDLPVDAKEVLENLLKRLYTEQKLSADIELDAATRFMDEVHLTLDEGEEEYQREVGNFVSNAKNTKAFFSGAASSTTTRQSFAASSTNP